MEFTALIYRHCKCPFYFYFRTLKVVFFDGATNDCAVGMAHVLHSTRAGRVSRPMTHL